MARNVVVDAGFVVALLSSRDNHHEWAVTCLVRMTETLADPIVLTTDKDSDWLTPYFLESTFLSWVCVFTTPHDSVRKRHKKRQKLLGRRRF